MTKEKRLFTSESVTEGHPDKIADQISDAILDAVLEQDPYARVAVETIVNTGLVVVFGEMTTTAYVDIQKVVRNKVKEIGYTRGKYGFDADNLAVMNTIDEQSPDIAQGVNNAYDDAEELGAGDQGLMFGYATNETPELMPLPIMLAHKLTQKLAEVRKNNTLAYLRPDGKAQVTIEYDEQDKPIRIDTVVVSSQHAPEIELEQLREDIKQHVILASLPEDLLDEDTRYLINPTGRFVIGGPHGDSGLCLAEGSKVSMADGSFKEIQDIQLDDEVLTETGTAHVIDHFSNGFKDTRVIDLGGLSLEATHNHPFRVFNEDTHELEWVEAGDLYEGDSVLVKERVYLQLLGGDSSVKLEQTANVHKAKPEYFTQNGLLSLKIQKITPSQAHTYDITLDDDTHAFVANGFIVHNTGRKIIVDTYGGSAKHGGGAYSSKDATKVDRSASYMARYIAKNIVAADLADKCEVQLAYAIGVAEPVSIRIDTFNTGKVSESDLVKAVRKVFKTTPGGIIEQLDLRRPIYAKTAAYGHFGRELPEFVWERKDKVDELKQVIEELKK